MRNTTKPKLAFVLQVESSYGTTEIVGSVVYLGDDGRLRSPLWPDYRHPEIARYADFRVHAYLDRDNPRAWGWGHSYTPHKISDIDHAQTILRMLRKIDKGLNATNSEQGYVDHFAAYLFRIAAILRIRTYYVRNFDKTVEMTGERFGRRDAMGVQRWITEHEKQRCQQPAET